MHKCQECGNDIEDNGRGHAWNCSHEVSRNRAYYFVAKTANGELVGQLGLEEIAQRLRDGNLSGNYVATKSLGPSYTQLTKSATANWTTVADLIGNWSAHKARENDPVVATTPSQCLKCSALLDADAKFCPSCASPVASAAPHCPNCFKAVDIGSRFCKNCATDLMAENHGDASSLTSALLTAQEIQRSKATKLAVAGGITAVVSAVVFLWAYSYTSNWSNMAQEGLSNLTGQGDPTYAIAQWCVTLGAIGFLVGLILFIVGLAQR